MTNTSLVPHLSPHAMDFTLECGRVFRAGTTVFRVTDLHGDIAILTHSVSCERKSILVSDLLARWTRGEIVLETEIAESRAMNGDSFSEDDQLIISRMPLDEFSDFRKEGFLRAIRYLRAMQEIGYEKFNPANKLIQIDLDRLQKKFGDSQRPMASWLYNASRKLIRAGGDPRAIVPASHLRGGKGRSRLPPAVDEAIARTLEKLRNSPTARIRTFSVVEDVQSILSVEHPDKPDLLLSINWTTIDRRVKRAFSPYELCVRNKSKAHADRTFRHSHPRDRAERPLEVAEADDTDSRVFIIDPRSGLPWGRAWITGVLDQCSNVLLGIELSEQSRSVWSAVSALSNAILPKDRSHQHYAEVKSDCEFFGKPGIVVFDNALYNHAKQIELAVEDHKIGVAWAKPKTPTEKADEERWNGRIKNHLYCELAGYRGDPKMRDGLAEGAASAVWYLDQFRQATLKWAYDVDANRPGTDGLTNRQRWHLGMRLARPRLPTDIHSMRMMRCLRHSLRLRSEGVLFGGLLFYSPWLDVLKKVIGHNAYCTFLYDPGNLENIFVLDAARQQYVAVPSVMKEYTAGLTLYQHSLVKKLAHENKVRNPSLPQYLMYREQLRVLTAQLVKSNKFIERRRGQRMGEIPTESVSAATTATKPMIEPTVIQTELEARIEEMSLISFDEEDEEWMLPIVL